MDIFEAVSSRYSCRAFLPKPVPEKTVRDIVERAARAPSAGNLQPWRIYAVAGKRRRGTEGAACGRAWRPNCRKARASNTRSIRARCRTLIARAASRSANCCISRSACRARTSRRGTGNMPAIMNSSARRWRLFFAREKAHGAAQWADIGGYLQTVALLARGHGLHTCPQQAWVSFHRTVRAFLNLPDHLMIYSGMALGYEDPAAAHQWLALPARGRGRFCVVRWL